MKINIDKVVENDYSLNMNLYKEIVLDVNEDSEVVELGELLTLIDSDISSKSIIEKPGDSRIVTLSKNSHDYKTTDEYIINGPSTFIGKIDSGGKVAIRFHDGKCKWINLLYYCKVNSKILSKYLYYILSHINDKLTDEYLIGSANKRLDKSFLKIKIPVPPLEVQNRIVEQLDNIYENEIESSKEVIKSLQFSIETIMKNTMYRNDLVEYTLKDACVFRKGNGISKPKRTGGDIPYYASNGQSSNSYMNKHNIDGNFILLAEDGYIGSIHYIPDGTKIWVGDHVHVINPKDDININIKYLYQSLNINVNYEIYTTGSVIPKLNKGNLEKIKIHIPPPEIQREILRKIEPKERLINQLEKNINRAEKEAKEIMDVLFK